MTLVTYCNEYCIDLIQRLSRIMDSCIYGDNTRHHITFILVHRAKITIVVLLNLYNGDSLIYDLFKLIVVKVCAIVYHLYFYRLGTLFIF